MNKTKKRKMDKGITLVALIITIIVLLILAVVTIREVQGDGIIAKAKESRTKYEEGQTNEQVTLRQYDKTIRNGMYEAVPTSISYVGYYADLNGDTKPERIIYIDIANSQSGSWHENSYTITNVTTNLKDYYISSKENYTEGPFPDKPIITVVPGSEGEDRFYVMALEDIKRTIDETECTEFYWWRDAYNKGISWHPEMKTTTGIGAGKTNADNMLGTNGAYGRIITTIIDPRDMWNVIGNEYEAGWFVPSKDEWAAFGTELTITSDNYSRYGLSKYYWSSSHKENDAWRVLFDSNFMTCNYVGSTYHVRLSTTF